MRKIYGKHDYVEVSKLSNGTVFLFRWEKTVLVEKVGFNVVAECYSELIAARIADMVEQGKFDDLLVRESK